MQSLLFRAPGVELPLSELLERAMPGLSRAALGTACQASRVRVDGRVALDLSTRCEAGVRVQADLPAPLTLPQPTPLLRVLARGEEWVVVDKPAGWPSHASREGGPDARQLVADALGRPLDEVRPAHRLDAAVSGTWLITLTEGAAARASRAFEERAVAKVYHALAPVLPYSRGRLEAPLDGRRAVTELELLEARGPIAAYALRPITGRTHQLRRHLAALEAPLLGDRRHGGVLVGGGLRLRAVRLTVPDLALDVESPWPDDPWPREPVFAPSDQPLELGVSQSTIAALRRGHPYILTDTETTDPGRFEAGRLLAVRGPTGESAGFARIEGAGALAARQWASPGTTGPGASVATRVEHALARRSELHGAARRGRTDAYRLVHGEADGLPGLVVDRLGTSLRLVLTGRSALPYLDPVAEQLGLWLAAELGEAPEIFEVVHLRERPAGELECVRRRPGTRVRSNGRLVVREAGLAFHVDVGLAQPTRPRPGVGLFTDQRLNRERLVPFATRGGRWLNLFAHTGAFSVALLAAGAEEVVSVDLSKPYLKVLEGNLALNGLDSARHQALRGDARRYLERLGGGERFAGMVVDPPTAAASGRRFWSVQRDGATLIELALAHLAPGGHLLLCRNDRRARDTLIPLVREVAKQARVRLSGLEDAPPGPDYPRLDGFPEGDAFAGVLVHRG